MEDSRSLQINAAAADDEDEFYEKIEAPKFVDFTAPDRCRPDDRYWFCLRVGCDQKHEEEMDPEEIYKNFVLRVMAARSPNVRLQKALNRKGPSSNMKCPLSAPAKSSKSRLSRLAVISSISQKKGNAKVKLGPLPELSSTPGAKTKQSVVAAKALTTPRNKKCLPTPDPFHSVRSTKATNIAVPKNRIVAKSLVFHSPKKVVRTKILQELNTPLTRICKGIKRLEITSQTKCVLGCPSKKPPRDIRRNYNKPWCLDASRRQLSPQKVKSSANGSSQDCKGKEAKSSLCHKLKNKDKDFKKCRGSDHREAVENDSSDMEIDEKSRNGSLEVQPLSGSSRSNEGNEARQGITQTGNSSSKNYDQEVIGCTLERPSSSENSGAASSDAMGADMNSQLNSQERDPEDEDIPKLQALCEEGDEVKEATEHGGKITFSAEEKFSQNFLPESQISKGPGHDSEPIEGDDKENASAYDKENDTEVMDSDDQENASASDDNRLNLNYDGLGRKVLGKHEMCRNTQKPIQVTNKTFKESLTSVITGAEGSKYRKPKPTNPKPFRLRTDERGILREANLERRLQNVAPLKDTATVSRFLNANSQRRQGNEIPRNEKGVGQSKLESDTPDSSEKESEKSAKNEPQQNKTTRTKSLKGFMEPKTRTATPQRQIVKKNEKANFVNSLLECSKNIASQKSDNSFKKTKSLLSRQLVRPNGAAPTRKKMVSTLKPGQLSVIKETPSTISRSNGTEKPSVCGATPAMKALTSTSRPSSRRRTLATIPKEPKFSSIHVPKSCTRKLV